jgi:putative transposase
VPVACQKAGIVEQAFYRWRKEHGGLQLEQAKRLTELKENAQLGTQRYQPSQRNDED